MYESGEEALVGDVVRGNKGLAEVLEVTRDGFQGARCQRLVLRGMKSSAPPTFLHQFKLLRTIHLCFTP